jgi:hypothetical protein
MYDRNTHPTELFIAKINEFSSFRVYLMVIGQLIRADRSARLATSHAAESCIIAHHGCMINLAINSTLPARLTISWTSDSHRDYVQRH